MLRWPAEAIWEAVAPALPGFTVEVLPALDSTNSELMRRARDGRTDPVLLLAEHQSAGRGRMGRSWISRPGASLTFSLAMALAPRDWSGLSLAVGLSVADSLHPDIRLKWPNDLWLDERKLAGILLETGSAIGLAPGQRYLVVGIGLNIERPQGELAGPLSTAPAGLCERLPALDAPAVLLRLVPPLVRTLLQFERTGFAPFRDGFQARDALRQRALRLSDGSAGTACGVDAGGGLLVHTAAGMKTVTSAEISVRPAAD